MTVDPSDARGAGHAASAEMLVHAKSIAAAAPDDHRGRDDGGGAAYTEGTWSTTPVTVTFTCTHVRAAGDARAPTP